MAKVKSAARKEPSAPQVHDFLKSAVVKAPGGKKQPDNKVVDDVPGLLVLASLDALEKTIKTLKAQAGDNVKAQMADTFVERGCALKRRPENYKGQELAPVGAGKATASLELRKRSEASGLDEAEVAVLEEYGVEYRIVTEYALNQECMTPANVAKLNKALSEAGLPANIFTAKTKTVVTDQSVEQIFQHKPVVAKCLLETVGTLACKPKLEGEAFTDTVQRVVALLGAEVERKGAKVQ